MLFAPKYSDPWKVLNDTNRDFSKLANSRENENQPSVLEPIAKRLRSRPSNSDKASNSRIFYMRRKSKR